MDKRAQLEARRIAYQASKNQPPSRGPRQRPTTTTTHPRGADLAMVALRALGREVDSYPPYEELDDLDRLACDMLQERMDAAGGRHPEVYNEYLNEAAYGMSRAEMEQKQRESDRKRWAEEQKRVDEQNRRERQAIAKAHGEGRTAVGDPALKHYEVHKRPVEKELERRGVEHPVIVCGVTDRPRTGPYVYLSHGYDYMGVEHESWPGGPGWDNCVLFLVPHEASAQKWRARYPQIPAVAVGCPKLDWWRDSKVWENRVLITFHWDCRVHPNVNTSYPTYEKVLPRYVHELNKNGYEVVLSSHPRALAERERAWKRAMPNVRVDGYTDAAMAVATHVLADHTSVLPEAAALGKKTLLLGHSGYDGSVLPRFPRVNSAEELMQLTDLSHNTRTPRHPYWSHEVDLADGLATQRAADAIQELNWS